MRLIRLINIILILITFFTSGNAQYQTKRVSLSETFLEERHLRYMYNFALNNTFFQYKSDGYHIQTPYFLKEPTPNEFVFILDHIFPIKIKDIELFNRPNNLQEVKIINNFNHPAESNGLTSQFDIKFIKFGFQTRKELHQQIHQMLFETTNSRFVVQFSNIVIHDKHIYVAIHITYPIMYSPDFSFSNSQIYEFEWCESVGWVYPRRVSRELFGIYLQNKGRLSGTIDIPSLKCY
jgi:hypothetical protein